MKRYFSVACLLFGLIGGAGSRAESAAARAPSGSWGTATPYHSLYEKGIRTTFDGRVLRTEDVVPLPNMEPGVQLHLEGDNGGIDVHLGPRWFVMERDLLFTKGAPIVVVGMTIRLRGKPTLIADEIIYGHRKDILRDPSGVPVWTKPAGTKFPK